jgi:hypothetical protein
MMTEPAQPPSLPPAAAAAAELPAVPRPRLSGRAIGLGVFGSMVIAGYAWLALTEYEPGSPAREEIPASMRSSTGGYRSFHFWHSGYHGGK